MAEALLAFVFSRIDDVFLEIVVQLFFSIPFGIMLSSLVCVTIKE